MKNGKKSFWHQLMNDFKLYLVSVLVNLVELGELMKENPKILLSSIFSVVKTAVRYSSIFHNFCEFKIKLVALVCDQIELQATKILEGGETAASNALKLIKFYIERLLEYGKTFCNEDFCAGVAVVELLFYLLKVENTSGVDEDKVAIVHRHITVGLLGVLKFLYADKEVFAVSLNLL